MKRLERTSIINIFFYIHIGWKRVGSGKDEKDKIEITLHKG